MRKHWLFALAMSVAATAQAQTRVDLSTLDEAMPGPRTQVLVLGSVHLSQGNTGTFDATSLKPVLERLRAFRPQIITIESMAGETCDLMRRRPSYKDVVESYCPDVAHARAATGLDVAAALDAIDTALAAWPEKPTPIQRRHLTSLYLAAGEPASALAQWWQLPESERHAGDGLDESLVQAMRKREVSANENYQIGARLAADLGLQRVVPIDDHIGDNLVITDEAAFEKAIRRAWDGASDEAKQSRAKVETLRQAGDMLEVYRSVNAPAYLRQAIDADFGQALREPSPQRFGRHYVGGWEARNLRMVANIRVAFREHPGARVLSIVGSSHKPWLDGLLGLMQGVDLVDAEKVLR